MITRHQYMAYFKKEYVLETNSATILSKILSSDSDIVADFIRKKACMTVALYRYKNMLFLYYEALDVACSPHDMTSVLNETPIPYNLFPALTEYLEVMPVKEAYVKWLPTQHIYHNAIPDTAKNWRRQGKKERIGRIAYLLPDKIMSYLYYHKELLDEGLFEGERYLSIGLYDTVLFTYSESPRIMTHLNSESNEQSTVIAEWRAQNPKSHFDHDFSGEGNFVDLEVLLSLGWEEIFDEQYI